MDPSHRKICSLIQKRLARKGISSQLVSQYDSSKLNVDVIIDYRLEYTNSNINDVVSFDILTRQPPMKMMWLAIATNMPSDKLIETLKSILNDHFTNRQLSTGLVRNSIFFCCLFTAILVKYSLELYGSTVW